jgi:DNA-binding NtrC family response regulator
MIRIQLVDDEPHILSALKRLLRSEAWHVDTFSSPEEALQALQANDYAVIVSDYQMPSMDGVTYLRFAKQRQPDALRMVLSAHGDRHSMMQAINHAEIYRFLSKPWEDYEIKTAIKAAVDLYNLKIENRDLMNEVRAQQNVLEKQKNELMRLESEHPGITRVTRDADGSVLLDDDQ